MAHAPGTGALIGVIAVFVLLGFPLVFVLWEALNHLLALEFGAVRWLLVLPSVLAFAVLLLALARVVRRITEAP